MEKPAAIVMIALALAGSSARADEPVINVRGLTDELQENVLAFLSLSGEKCKSPEWRVKKQFARADGEINKALRALGHYRPVIEKKLEIKEGCWQADFDIDPGEAVKVATLSVVLRGEAEEDEAFGKLLKALPLASGDTLNHALYEKIKQDLQSLALEHGFLRHKFSKKSLRVDPVSGRADIELVFDSGPRFHFGAITIDQTILDPEFVHRYIAFEPDDPYSSKKLAKTYNDLADSLYFSNVEITPQVDQAKDRRVPVKIDLTQAKRHAYSAGVGFATDIGPLGNLGYQNRYFNRRGHHLSFQIEGSPVLSSAEGQYMIPYTRLRNDYVSLGLGYKLERPDTFESKEAKISLQQQHFFQGGWKQNFFIDLTNDSFKIGNEDQQNTTLLVTGARWQYTQSNDAIRPTEGYHLNFSLAAAPESLVSDVNFIQATAYGKLIGSLPWSARLITRAQLGSTLTDNFNQLPPSYRFYAGGTETLRGYAYKEVGPTDGDGNVLGGEMLTIASLEYEQFINESWGVAAFVDSGNAYKIGNFEIKTGVGLGVRWLSPIGPIRLDFAVPLSDTDASFQIHFAAGAQL